jgi:hypothetical protein
MDYIMDWIGTKAVTAHTHTPTIFPFFTRTALLELSSKNQALQQLSAEKLDQKSNENQRKPLQASGTDLDTEIPRSPPDTNPLQGNENGWRVERNDSNQLEFTTHMDGLTDWSQAPYKKSAAATCRSDTPEINNTQFAGRTPPLLPYTSTKSSTASAPPSGIRQSIGQTCVSRNSLLTMATSWPKLLRDELEFYRFNLHFCYNIERRCFFYDLVNLYILNLLNLQFIYRHRAQQCDMTFIGGCRCFLHDLDNLFVLYSIM